VEQQGVLLCAENQEGFPPIHEACTNRHTEVVALLLGAGAEVDAQSNRISDEMGMARGNDMIPLHTADAEGHVDMVNFLLKAGADVNATADNNARDLNQATPLIHACCSNNHQRVLVGALNFMPTPSSHCHRVTASLHKKKLTDSHEAVV